METTLKVYISKVTCSQGLPELNLRHKSFKLKGKKISTHLPCFSLHTQIFSLSAGLDLTVLILSSSPRCRQLSFRHSTSYLLSVLTFLVWKRLCILSHVGCREMFKDSLKPEVAYCLRCIANADIKQAVNATQKVVITPASPRWAEHNAALLNTSGWHLQKRIVYMFSSLPSLALQTEGA